MRATTLLICFLFVGFNLQAQAFTDFGCTLSFGNSYIGDFDANSYNHYHLETTFGPSFNSGIYLERHHQLWAYGAELLFIQLNGKSKFQHSSNALFDSNLNMPNVLDFVETRQNHLGLIGLNLYGTLHFKKLHLSIGALAQSLIYMSADSSFREDFSDRPPFSIIKTHEWFGKKISFGYKTGFKYIISEHMAFRFDILTYKPLNAAQISAGISFRIKDV